MMILGQTQPLQIAARILNKDNLELFRRSPFNQYGWAILDRWAMNEPEALKELQQQGTVVIYDRVLQQQEVEQEVLLTNHTELLNGLTAMEVLQAQNIPTNLK